MWYISDTHFGHRNAVEKHGRPFSSIEEHDETIIANWNSKVGKDEIVYVLGDFWYRGQSAPINYIKRLKGKKILIAGNHDKKWLRVFGARGFESVHQYLETENAVLFHYPIVEWNGEKRGVPHIFGHVHANHTPWCAPNSYNACVDINGWSPVTMEELKINHAKWRKTYEDIGD